MATTSSQPASLSAPTLPGHNRRATVRYRCPPACSGRVYLAEDVEFQRAWLENLSATGIGLLLGKPIDYGLLVTIVVKGHNSDKKYTLPAHAMHSTQLPSGDWLVGCQFVEMLPDELLDDLL